MPAGTMAKAGAGTAATGIADGVEVIGAVKTMIAVIAVIATSMKIMATTVTMTAARVIASGDLASGERRIGDHALLPPPGSLALNSSGYRMTACDPKRPIQIG